MSKPTLFKPGGLIANKWSEPQAKLDQYVPVEYLMNWFKGKFKKNGSPADRILILKSATGSGKSSTFPAELFLNYYDEIKRGIACLQPTVVNTLEVPLSSVLPFYDTKEKLRKMGHGAKEPLELGVNIGYQTSAFATKAVRGLTYMTIGTLAQQLAIMTDEDFMNKYAFIIVDEAHVRSIDTDMVLYTLKRFVNRNYKNLLCPFVVVTSATFDTVHFCNYMLGEIKAPERYKNIIEVSGETTFPIVEKFLDYDSKNYIQSTVDTIVRIHKDYAEDFLGPVSTKKGKLDEDAAKEFVKATHYRDILVFISGSADIKAIKTQIDKINGENEFFKQYPVIALKLTGTEVGEQTEDYKSIFNRSIDQLNVEVKIGASIQIKKPVRRVVLSTNAGETGLTLNAVKHVIDTGFRKGNEYNPTFGVEGLILQPVTKGIHTQRKGRVGRRSPGFSFPMFTEASFNDLKADSLPDMLLKEMSLQILKMIILEADPDNKINENLPVNLFCTDPVFTGGLRYEIKNARDDFLKNLRSTSINITKFDLLDLPSADAIHEALEKLYVLGAIDSNIIPTSIGFLMNRFQYIPVESIKMILSGFAWGASISDLATIAAFMYFQKDLRPRKMEKTRARAAMRNVSQLGMSKDAAQHISGYSALFQNILIADDFISNLLLYFDFQKHIERTFIESETTDQSEIESMEAWCAERGVDYVTIVNAIARRDDIIYSLASIGLNPFQNDHHSLSHIVDTYQNGSRDELLICVKRLKQCIYEGYKLNMAEWNPKNKAYITRQNHLFLPFFHELFVGKRDIEKYGDGNPRFILYNFLSLKLNQNSGVYMPEVHGISVLDGFVSIDTTAF